MRQRFLLLAGLIIIGFVGGAGYLGFRSTRQTGPDVPPVPVTVAVTRGDVEQTVTAPGQVLGTREVILGMRVAGRLAEIAVRPGQEVQAGQVLARLETEPLLDALETARFELAQAEAAHARQLAEAQLNFQIATSRLAQARAGVPTTAAAEAALAAAQAELQQLLSGPDEDELTGAAAELRRAEIALQQAQWAYDRVAYAADLGASPEAAQLEEATIEYEARLAAFNLIARGASGAELARARAQVQQALADYDRLRNERQISEQEIATAEAEVARARLELEQLEAGVDRALARAVEIAEKDLAAAALTAPFDGVVLEVMARPGETVGPERSLILLADPAAVEVQATVIEEDLPLVRVGQPAELFFDARPDEGVAGQVVRIVPQRVPGKDRPLYDVYIVPRTVPEGVVTGMTADASIIVARRADVLRLPRALVRARSDGTAQVTVWVDGHRERRAVQVGLRGDVYAEIVAGLGDGEQVVGE